MKLAFLFAIFAVLFVLGIATEEPGSLRWHPMDQR